MFELTNGLHMIMETVKKLYKRLEAFMGFFNVYEIFCYTLFQHVNGVLYMVPFLARAYMLG